MSIRNSSNTTAIADSAEPPHDLLTDEQYWTAMTFFMVLDAVAGVLATGANIINLVVYIKMGFSDSINISLTALSLSDLGIAVTTVGTVVGFLLPFVPNASFTAEIFFAPVNFPHSMFTKVSALVTTYISLEICLCVLIPLRVKTFFNPTKILAFMLIFYGTVWCLFPIFILRHPIGWKFYPEKNETLLGVIPVKDPTIVFLDKARISITAIFIPVSTLSIVSVCTVMLIGSLQRSKAWRESTSCVRIRMEGGPEAVRSKAKETKAIKMVVVIAVVFIVTTVPSCIHDIVSALIEDFSFEGRNIKFNNVLGMAYFGINSMNGGFNLLIYYIMSMKFRQALNGAFKRVS